jgi:hypothetical protein
MRAPTCRSCEAKIEGRPAFCARCGEPTPFASAEQRTQHDLEKWRRHRETNDAAPVRTARVAASVRAATDPTAPATSLEQPHVVRRRVKTKTIKTKTVKEQPVIDLDADDPFAYSACVSCHRTDWLVRTGRNEDGSFRYWCLRCSRSFKTDVRLAHAVKPFVVAGSILTVLTLLANFH